ncbi:MAG: ABC transporter ATP-binding protein [Chloroflexi bacterium]|nr:ABC transporter ATP-binding protein [Chloroflexota bacterium]
MCGSDAAIETVALRKVFDGTKVAVEGLTLRVGRGEVFGFLGPNGAGKTTSVNMLLGLVKPTSGRATLLGTSVESYQARMRVGFLPEHFRFHEWMRADEFLDLHGRLYGMSRTDRVRRAQALIERVDLKQAAQDRLGEFSKGMLQRIGLAMALLPHPDLVFLDEPTSGLDPFGRLLVRDVIRTARDEGTTVFINSHLLSEVEVTCDRVAFIRHGQVIRAGSLKDLAAGSVRIQVRLERVPQGFADSLAVWGDQVKEVDEQTLELTVADETRVADLNVWLVAQGLRVLALAPQRPTLEQLFIQVMQDDGPETNV